MGRGTDVCARVWRQARLAELGGVWLRRVTTMRKMLVSVMVLAGVEANTARQVACDLGKARSQGGANEVCGSSRPPLQLRVWHGRSCCFFIGTRSQAPPCALKLPQLP